VVASSCSTEVESTKFTRQEVGNGAFLQRHNSQIFAEGRSFSGNERDKVFLNDGDATFIDVSDLSGADSPNDGRAVLAFDADDDGDVDLFVHENQRERHALYRNDIQGGDGFVKLTLEGTRFNAEAIGATVVAAASGRRTAQVLSRGAGFVSCQTPELVFGLGAAATADVHVRWPGGGAQTFTGLARGGRYHLVEGAEAAATRSARARPLPNPRPAGLFVDVGDRIEPFELLDASGAAVPFDAAAFSGPVYLNFWATYCGPCVAELPELARLQRAGEAHVVPVSVDSLPMRDGARALVAERAMNLAVRYPTEVIATRRTLHDVVDLDRLPIPTTIVLDNEGVVTRVISGPLKSD